MSDERKQTLDEIRRISDRLTTLSRRYDNLRWMAENDASGAFLNLAMAAGKMTEASLEQLATLLDLMYRANLVGEKKDGDAK
jgi:hypothetical protein